MTYSGSQAQSGRGSTLAIGATLSITGTLTLNSASVTAVSSTAGIVEGMPISGAGIPAATTIASVGTNTLTLSAEATAAGAGETLSVGPATIGEIKTSNIGNAQWGTADVTNFESGADQEFINTIRNNGEVSVAGNRVSSDPGQTLVEAAFSSGAIQAFTLTLPKTPSQTTSGDSYAFNALVVSRDIDVDVTKEISWSVKLKVSGPVTLTKGS